MRQLFSDRSASRSIAPCLRRPSPQPHPHPQQHPHPHPNSHTATRATVGRGSCRGRALCIRPLALCLASPILLPLTSTRPLILTGTSWPSPAPRSHTCTLMTTGLVVAIILSICRGTTMAHTHAVGVLVHGVFGVFGVLLVACCRAFRCVVGTHARSHTETHEFGVYTHIWCTDTRTW